MIITFGIILLIFHILFLYVILSDIKRIIVFREKVDAYLKSVLEEIKETEDCKSEYNYDDTFVYDYNGQSYKSSHSYSKHCIYYKGQNTAIIFIPNKPTESWTKGELKNGLLK